ncbi:MAG: ABC transporter permease [Flavobacteriales bacterium]|nr:MAG: ABC transporter permease [Flavobacteriales bacterium]
MKFPIYFSKKIAFSKDNKNNLSKFIIFIGRLSVALGIIVSLLTISIGLGSKRAIKERMADFNGHIKIKSTLSNSSNNSSILDTENLQLEAMKNLSEVAKTQSYASVMGILRTEKDFNGIIYKGVGKDFDYERFEKFLVKGTTPKITEKGYNNQITISQKIAKSLGLKPKDSIVAIFSKENQKPIYRKFEIVGIYKTDIKMIDDYFVIGDINHARKILNMKKNEIGGIDVFLKNINAIDTDFPLIEELKGFKNYAEKATDKYPEILNMIHIFDNNILIIISLMLIVVVMNIVMVLLILIIERTNSIGLLKTLGATNGQIRTIFINYTLMIMIPGLIIGNLIGLGILVIQKVFSVVKLDPENYFISSVPVDLNPIIPIAVSLGILIISAIALIIPSYFISKISPAQSVRYQ